MSSPPPPPPPPSGEANLKPLVAAVFAAVLVIVGAWSSRRRPWKNGTRRKAVLTASVATALPFVLAESATGVVSFVTGLLSIPPIVGFGTAADLGVLIAGLIVAMYRGFRRVA